MGTGYRHGVKRHLVAAGVVVAVVALFSWEWAAAPRVHASAAVTAQLASARGELYLGGRFEGLPLRTVDPFLYSDCIPGRAHVVPCRWVRVAHGAVTGSDPRQVVRARGSLHRVG
jgi:hypothetical protein